MPQWFFHIVLNKVKSIYSKHDIIKLCHELCLWAMLHNRTAYNILQQKLSCLYQAEISIYAKLAIEYQNRAAMVLIQEVSVLFRPDSGVLRCVYRAKLHHTYSTDTETHGAFRSINCQWDIDRTLDHNIKRRRHIFTDNKYCYDHEGGLPWY